MTAARNAAPILMYSAASILIATPNAGVRRRLSEGLRRMTAVDEAGSGAEALSKLERRGARVVLLDRKLPDLNSEELVELVEHQYPGTDVLLMDGESGTVEVPEEMCCSAVAGWLEELKLLPVQAPAARAAESGDAALLLPGMVGASAAMREVCALVQAVAGHSTPVLITGETGVGKEVVAEAVHRLSPRASQPFVTINCAAIPEALIEAELFGHTRGAFTGAVQARLGRIHAAQGGTIFFDEIGELPLASQSKVLRFLESGEVQRLGTSDVFRMDARVIAATNVELERRVEQGLFREDLYYRLSVFPIEVPPLRERPGDIPLLARYFTGRLASGAVKLAAESEAKLAAHYWPGNVRELRNVMERAFVLSNGGGVIAPEHVRLRKPCASVRTSESS